MKNNLGDFKKKRICQCFECADFLNALEAELREMLEGKKPIPYPLDLIEEILGE